MRAQRAAFVVALVLGASVVAPAARACGVCIEDKVAATYDHAVVQQALARHQVVVYAAIEGVGDAVVLAREVQRAAARAPGVAKASVRTAAQPAAVSFALDPRVAAPEATLATIAEATAAHRVKLSVLRVAR